MESTGDAPERSHACYSLRPPSPPRPPCPPHAFRRRQLQSRSGWLPPRKLPALSALTDVCARQRVSLRASLLGCQHTTIAAKYLTPARS